MTELLHEAAMPLLPPSPGAMIKAGRERAGIHLAVLSVNLKVSIKQLEALEADQFDRLSGTVFARALAAKVCRFVKIDPDAVLALMPANINGLKPLNLIGADQASAYPSHHVLPRSGARMAGLKGWLIALLLAALVLVFVGKWIVSSLHLERQPEAAEVVPTMPPVQEPVTPDSAQAELPKAMVFDSPNSSANTNTNPPSETPK
jgi:cytoskeleton protein RodZ